MALPISVRRGWQSLLPHRIREMAGKSEADSPLVFFPHIPKAGGQTLIQGFYEAFGAEKCIKVWDPNFGADIDPAEFRNLSPDRFKGMSAVVGHLPVENFFENAYARGRFDSGRVRILTSVRHPIQRIISLYNYIAHSEQHPSHEEVRNISPVDFLLSQPADFQYHFLRWGDVATPEALFGAMEIFPIEQSIAGFSGFFDDTFGIHLGNLEIINKSEDLVDIGGILSDRDIPAGVMDDLADTHHTDLELYQKAWDISAEQSAADS